MIPVCHIFYLTFLANNFFFEIEIRKCCIELQSSKTEDIISTNKSVKFENLAQKLYHVTVKVHLMKIRSCQNTS